MLQQILERNELDEPDGRPIYAYEVTHKEYEVLQEKLKEWSDRPARRWSNLAAAAFCMFVAEWWRREYTGGRWSFQGPLCEIGMANWVERNRYSQLHDIISRGLDYLGQDLVTLGGNDQYLGTLASQGGLPLNLIREQGNALTRTFSAMFRELRIFGVGQTSAEELGQAEFHRLPQTYQRAGGLAQLLGEMAIVVWQYANIVEEADQPLNRLDNDYPTWRDELPLRARDTQLRGLLDEILGEAREERATEESPIQAVRRLREKEDGWELVVDIENPKRLREEQLADLLGVDENALPYTLKLKAETGGQDQLVATVSRSGDVYIVEDICSSRVFKGESAWDTVRLHAYAGDNKFGNESPVIAEGIGDEPWIFSPHDDASPRQLFATGSVRTRREEALVVVERRSEVRNGEKGAHEELGELGATERSVVRVLGEVKIHDDEETNWRIKCSADRDVLNESTIRGQIWGIEHARGLPVYKASPEVQVGINILSDDEVLWARGGQEFPLSEAPFGDGRIRVYDEDGHAILQKRIARLPESASITVEPSTTHRSGRLLLRGFGAIRTGTSHEEIRLDQEGNADGVRVEPEYTGTGREPSDFELVIQWQDEGGETSLIVPFPSERARFTANGQVLEHRADWVAHSLHEVTAEVSTTNGNIQRPRLVGKLRADDVSYEICRATEFDVQLRTEYTGTKQTGRYILNLDRVQEEISLALAGTMDLDAHIELSLTWPGATHAQQKQLKLYRYEGKIEERGDQIFGRTSRLTPPEHWETPKVVAFRFQSAEETRTLRAMQNHEWLAERDEWEPGTWSVLGIRHGRLSHRPAIVQQQGEATDDEWSQVCEIPNRDRRRRQFRHLYQDIATEPGHDAWRELSGVFEVAKELPATTFDALDCLIEVPKATAMALLMAGSSNIERWWNELQELPFSWHLISIDDWRKAIRAYRDYSVQKLKEAGLEDVSSADNLGFIAREMARRLGGHSPAFALLNQEMELGLDIPTRELQFARARPEMVREHLYDGFNELLIRRNSDHFWWPSWDPKTNLRDLDRFEEYRLDVPAGAGWRQPVADAPIVAAIASATTTRLPRADVIRLRRLRNFDQRWFDFCYRATLARILTT
jgi:hypothetical protein